MTEKLCYELVVYPCEGGSCLVIHEKTHDSKLGSLSLDHRSIGKGIIDELNKLADELYAEQLRTTPIVYNTHISDEDFDKIERMIIKQFDSHSEMHSINKIHALQKENKRFIIDVEETHQENAVFEYNDNLEDYVFVCFEDDSDALVERLNEQDETIHRLEDARKSYKQDWKACVSYCDTYKCEIHVLKDNIEGLKEDKKVLEQQVRQLSLIGEKQADFILSKGFDIEELIDFARNGEND